MVTQAETLDPFASRIGVDYERYTAGTVMLETAERLVVEEQGAGRCSSSCCSSAPCARCATPGAPTGPVLDSFLLRSLAVAGYAPSFDGVRALRRSRARTGAFSPAAGGMLCATCRVPGHGEPGR